MRYQIPICILTYTYIVIIYVQSQVRSHEKLHISRFSWHVPSYWRWFFWKYCVAWLCVCMHVFGFVRACVCVCASGRIVWCGVYFMWKKFYGKKQLVWALYKPCTLSANSIRVQLFLELLICWMGIIATQALQAKYQ